MKIVLLSLKKGLFILALAMLVMVTGRCTKDIKKVADDTGGIGNTNGGTTEATLKQLLTLAPWKNTHQYRLDKNAAKTDIDDGADGYIFTYKADGTWNNGNPTAGYATGTWKIENNYIVRQQGTFETRSQIIVLDQKTLEYKTVNESLQAVYEH